MVLSEHWLWPYELHKLNQISEDYEVPVLALPGQITDCEQLIKLAGVVRVHDVAETDSNGMNLGLYPFRSWYVSVNMSRHNHFALL